VNFNVSKVSEYRLEYAQAYSAGLTAILIGLIMHIFGWAIMGFTNMGKR